MSEQKIKGFGPMDYDLSEVFWASRQIREKVRMVVANEADFSVLSTGERIAVAVVLDRIDLLQRAWGTIAEAIYRLGPEWTRAALHVQRMGWEVDDGLDGIING
jgi:hypothetical protein